MLPETSRFSVSRAAEGWLLHLAAEGRSKHTLADYSYDIRFLVAWLQASGRPDLPAVDLTTDDLRHFLADLRQRQPPLGAKTLKNVYTALSSFWSWLGVELGVAHILKGHLSPPRASPPAIQIPTREQIERLLKACDQTREAKTRGRRGFRMKRRTGLRDRCVVLIFLDTGLRAQELCSLTMQDVDLASGSILVRRGKGDKARVVYAGKATRRALWRYVAGERQGAGPRDPLFLGLGGRTLSRGGLERVIRGLGRKAGFACWPHLLRHTFATEFLRGGGTTLALRRLLGHVSDALLARYAQLAECDLQAAHASASPADRWRL